MNILLDVTKTSAWKIFSSGAIVNFILIIIGSLLGLVFKRGIPERVRQTLMSGMALCVLYIGITGLINSNANIIVIIISIAIGTIIGELIDIDKHVNNFGKYIEMKINKNGNDFKIAEGFVTATLLFCVGAMSVVGSIESGLKGNNSTLYSKSLIDCISAVAFTSSLGIGVMFSAAPVLILEGGLTLLAVLVSPILTSITVAQMTIIGSLLIIAISFNMMGITKIKVMNCIPAIFLPIILCLI